MSKPKLPESETLCLVFSLRLRPDLLRRVEAASNGRPLGEYIRLATEAALARDEKKRRKPKRTGGRVATGTTRWTRT